VQKEVEISSVKERKKRRQSQKLNHGFVMKMVEKKTIFYLSLGQSVIEKNNYLRSVSQPPASQTSCF